MKKFSCIIPVLIFCLMLFSCSNFASGSSLLNNNETTEKSSDEDEEEEKEIKFTNTLTNGVPCIVDLRISSNSSGTDQLYELNLSRKNYIAFTFKDSDKDVCSARISSTITGAVTQSFIQTVEIPVANQNEIQTYVKELQSYVTALSSSSVETKLTVTVILTDKKNNKSSASTYTCKVTK